MPPVERKLAAILHADVVGYSRLMAMGVRLCRRGSSVAIPIGSLQRR